MLSALWGFNEAEIGNIFGVSESRICQRLKRIQERLSARVKKEAGLPRERAREVEALGREENPGLSLKASEGMAKEASRAMDRDFETLYQKRLT